MKKLLLLFVALSAFTFTSCGDDDDNGSSIVGKWYLYSKTKEGKTKVIEYECKNKDYVEFTSDGKIKSYEYDVKNECKKQIDIDGTYIFKDNKVTVTEENNKEGYTTLVTIKGDVMEITSESGNLGIWKRLK